MKFLNFHILILLLFIFTVHCPASFALERDLTEPEIEKLNKNLIEDPKNIISRRFLIYHYFKNKNWTKVASLGEPIQKELGASDQILLAKNYLELQDGKGAAAVIGFFHSKNNATSESKLIEAKAHIFLAQKEVSPVNRKVWGVKIIDVLRAAILLDPKTPQPYLTWVDVLKTFWTSYAEDALQVYRQLELATKDTESYLDDKCSLYVLAQLWDQAHLVCQKATALPEAPVDSFVNLAKAQAVKVSVADSKKTLESLSSRFPENASAHKTLATFYLQESNYISAAEHFRKATELDPKDAESYLLLAQSEFQQKKYQDALSSFKKNCQMTRTLASEFKHSTGELRKNNSLHLQYKNVMSSCQK